MNILDRRVRSVLVAPVAVVIGIVIGPGSVGSIVLYALAAIMLATSAVGYCLAVFAVPSRARPPPAAIALSSTTHEVQFGLIRQPNPRQRD